MAQDIGDRIVDSLRAKTKTAGEQLGRRIDFGQVLKHYAANRAIVRLAAFEEADEHLTVITDERGNVNLSEVPDGRGGMVLKGGMNLVWSDMSEFARATSDMDIHLYDYTDEQEVIALFEKAFALDLGDGCRFEIGKKRRLEHVHGEHEGLRIVFKVYAGKTRIDFQADIGMGGARPTKVRRLQVPTMFEGQSTSTIWAQTFEYSLSEKLHAMVQKGLVNTRLKDYRDAFVLSPRMNQGALAEAVEWTFADRGMEIPSDLPEGLSDEYAALHQEDWIRFLDGSSLRGTVPESLHTVVASLRDRYMPIFENIVPAATFTCR